MIRSLKNALSLQLHLQQVLDETEIDDMTLAYHAMIESWPQRMFFAYTFKRDEPPRNNKHKLPDTSELERNISVS